MDIDLNNATIGAISHELKKQKPTTRDPIALERAMHKDYEKNINECVERGKKHLSSDFYVIVITKKERLMDNVIRNYFTFRKSAPTPEWDQGVYRYSYLDDNLEFLWVIPSKDTCDLLRDNCFNVDKSERELLKFVLDYEDGTLFRLAKKLNGESATTPLLKNKERYVRS